jgi:hypothetical protein
MRDYVVSIVGPDGTGKSTLYGRLADLMPSRLLHIHSHPRVLPFLRQTPRVESAHSDPHARDAHSTLKSLAKVTIVALDWTAFWLSRRLTRDSRIVVVERGWWDQAVDPKRYRISESALWLVRLLGRVLPASNLVLMPNPSAEEVLRRKAELPSHEVVRQYAAWSALGRRAGRVTLNDIDAMQLAEMASTQIARDWLPALKKTAVPMLRPVIASARAGALRNIYPPGTRTGQAARSVSAVLAEHRPGGHLGSDHVVRRLVAQIGLHHLDPVRRLYAFGSSATDRWVVAVAKASGAKSVLKTHPGVDSGINRERAMLARFDKANLPFRVPRLVSSGDVDGGGTYLETDLLPRGRSCDTEQVLSLGAALHGLGLVHGDFAPWNMMSSEGEISLLDWEAAREEFIPGFDIVHYVVKKSSLLERRPAGAIFVELLSADGLLMQHLERVGMEGSPAEHVRAYLLAEHVGDESRVATRTRQELRVLANV